MTHLKEKLGDKINGKIAKAMIDFDSYQELKQLLEEFKPDVIGIRTLNFYADFFHQTAAMIRHWGINAPIIAGGPYATSSYQLLLQDQLIALAVLGEGEITFHQLIGKILENGGRLPGEEVLKEIPGLAFVAKEAGVTRWQSREILLWDQLSEVLSRDTVPSTGINRDGDNKEKTGLVASFMFDDSVERLFGPLLQGGGVYIVPGAMGLKGINALEFYQERTAGQQGPSLHIRVQLESDLLTGLPSSKGEKYIAPRNEIEEKLTKIWAEVLNMDEAFIGVNDNFFELGGHSLNIVQVKNLLKERLGRTIPIARIFAYPTIDSFSRYLQEEETDDIASDVKIKESVDLMEETMQLLIGEDNE
jgi:acyl carrier protein